MVIFLSVSGDDSYVEKITSSLRQKPLSRGVAWSCRTAEANGAANLNLSYSKN
jgi:hypothetical protein